MEEAATQLRLRLRPEPRKSKNFELLVETHEIVYSSGDVDSDADSVFEGFERYTPKGVTMNTNSQPKR